MCIKLDSEESSQTNSSIYQCNRIRGIFQLKERKTRVTGKEKCTRNGSTGTLNNSATFHTRNKLPFQRRDPIRIKMKKNKMSPVRLFSPVHLLNRAGRLWPRSVNPRKREKPEAIQAWEHNESPLTASVNRSIL